MHFKNNIKSTISVKKMFRQRDEYRTPGWSIGKGKAVVVVGTVVVVVGLVVPIVVVVVVG